MLRILVLTVAVMSLSVAGCSARSDYPHKTVKEAAKIGNYMGWQLLQVLGDNNGPFRNLGDHQLNSGMRKWVTYRMDGVEKKHDLSDVQDEVLLGRFENKAGNSMVLVFTKKPG